MQLRLATLNTQNLGHNDPGWRLRGLAEALVCSMQSPDLICLQEICGSDPPDDSGRVGASGTLAAIRAALVEAGAPDYRFLECPPLPGEQGGKAGAEIRTCLAYRPDRLRPTPLPRVFSDIVSADATHLPLGDQQPVFAGDQQRGWAPSRRPIAASFAAADRPLTIIGCHLKSMRAPSRASAIQFKAQRVAQAEYLAHLARRLTLENPEALLVIAGDLNDTPGSSTLAAICGDSLSDPGRRLPPRRRYTAVHDKGRVTLDYLLLSRWAEPAALQQVPHLNTGIAPPVRFSDHDPVLVELPWPGPEQAGL